MNYPTDLTPDEQRRARARLDELAEQFTFTGTLRTPSWRAVFERTWRHPYVPGYYPDKDSALVLCVDGARRDEWLDAVYSDTTLITKSHAGPTLACLTARHPERSTPAPLPTPHWC